MNNIRTLFRQWSLVWQDPFSILPLTAINEVDILVIDVGYFEIKNSSFILKEAFSPYTKEFIQNNTAANLIVASDFN